MWSGNLNPIFPSWNWISVYLVLRLTDMIFPTQPSTSSVAGHMPVETNTNRVAPFSSVSGSNEL